MPRARRYAHGRAYLLESATTPQFSVASNIIAKEGFGSLYKGLSAGLLRQATYTTARLGIFNSLSDALRTYNDGKVTRGVFGWHTAHSL